MEGLNRKQVGYKCLVYGKSSISNHTSTLKMAARLQMKRTTLYINVDKNCDDDDEDEYCHVILG